MKPSLMCAVLVAWTVAAAPATQAPQPPPVFRGGGDIVRVFVTVTNRDGRLVTTLPREAFELRDEGKPQPITQFDNTPQPIRLIVMLDVSGSMEGNLPLLRAGPSSCSRGCGRTMWCGSARSATRSRSARVHARRRRAAARRCPPRSRRTRRRRSGARIDKAIDAFGDGGDAAR